MDHDAGIDAVAFLVQVRPALASGNAQKLAQSVCSRWNSKQVCKLLSHSNVDARRVAAITLGLITPPPETQETQTAICGSTAQVRYQPVTNVLLRALHDPDKQVVQMAEQSLRTVWLRSGHRRCIGFFRQANAFLEQHHYRQAIHYYRQTVAMDRTFAQAHHQCALAYYGLDQWAQAIICCARALKCVATHFDALAMMGHCYTQQDQLHRALRCYRQAIGIHPGLHEIKWAIVKLEGYIHDPSASGEFEAAGAY